MTENPEKKKPLIIESSDSSISSDKSSASQKSSNTLPSDRKKELDEVFGPLNSSSSESESSSKVPSTSSSVPSTSTSAQEESSSSSQSNDLKISEAGLEEEYKQLNCNNENFYSNDCNKFLLKKELLEREKLEENPEANPYLYPNLNDKEFNIKIATKKEFNDTKYDGTIHDNIKEQADILAKADFELQPHQAFVKNFMSFQTPYSSLLLYHGLGSGKTCSAIGVCEEMRDYMKQMGITKRIIIVASENVQDNFKLQLFDERKLKLVDGVWNIRACTGNKLLKEINPMNMAGMSKEKVVSQIKNLINTYYIFLGYVQFANYIIKTMNYEEEVKKQSFKKTGEKKKGEKSKIQMLKDVKIELNSRIIKRLQNEFNNRLIVIDEVHNIRKTDDNENKKVAINLELLVKSALNMRFLLLSATPMYNSYKEIVWLLNIMNTNDRRGRIEVRDIFKKNGEFKDNGEELLTRKSTGYISFVRGENPYTFPYRVYPSEFAKEDTFPAIKYPSYQMNLKKIKHEDKKRVLSLYLTKINECGNCGKCQFCAYKYIIYNLRNKKFSITTKTGVVREMPSFENMESFGYTLLQTPLESLIISYPVPGLKSILDRIPQEKLSEEFTPSFSESKSVEEAVEEESPGPLEEIPEKEENETKSTSEEFVLPPKKKPLVIESSSEGGANTSDDRGFSSIDPHQLTGKIGLERMMNFVDEKSPPVKGDFEYKKTTIDNYGKIFSREHIGKYSAKIKCILDNIVNPENERVSDGVILIYSQYIDSGLIPMALALEEMGFTRYGSQGTKPLFKHRPTEVVDVKTMKAPEDKRKFMPARYAMITGETRLSPNNDFEVKGLTSEDNKDGHKVKVVLISKAGSEGIDLKFIRQVHILEPWYNMNRIEQIIGRAVRNFSHKDLVFEKRNVEIFMYGTILGNNQEEAADLYVYRVAEYKAIQIGKVTRVLKETSVDCLINHDQTNFTQKIMNASLKEPITQELSNGMVLKDFKVGDSPFSPACDYMAECNYDCRPDKKINDDELNEDTYNENFIIMNSEKILQRIRMLMKESFFYKKDVLIKSIQTPKEYPYVQIFSALTQLIEDENEFISDKYGRNGRLINIGEYYLFQPIELRDKNASIFDRSVPIDYKHDMIKFEIKQNIVKPVIDKRNVNKFIIEEEMVFTEGKRLVDEMKVNFDITREFTKQTKVPRGDDNWYKHCGVVIKKMSKDFPESKEYLISYLVAHMLDILVFEDKLEVMNYLYSLDSLKKGTFEWLAKEYIEMNSIATKNFVAFVMYKLNKRMIMILNNKNKWVEAEPEDQREIAASKEAKEYLTLKPEEYNRIIGFIGYEKSNRYLVFKTKDMNSKRDTGARCDEAGKIKTIAKLNEILGENKYTNESTKAKKDEDGNIISEAVGQVELCVLQEFILRFFNTIKRDEKKWFFTPELAIWHKLYTIFV
jgi:superfamily II DNA or RNA helicase